MKILAIDPGELQSGWMIYQWSGHGIGEPLSFGITPNQALVELIENGRLAADVMAIEMMQMQGMPVGQSTFEACAWIGAFWHAFGSRDKCTYIKRNQEKMAICGNMRAKPPNIRRGLIDMFGGEDTAIGGVSCKKCKGKGWFGAGRPTCPVCNGAKWKYIPGPLNGVTHHVWSALAVAVTYTTLLQSE